MNFGHSLLYGLIERRKIGSFFALGDKLLIWQHGAHVPILFRFKIPRLSAVRVRTVFERAILFPDCHFQRVFSSEV